MAGKKMGRESLLTPEMSKSICGLLAKGNTIKDACILSGISTITYYSWRAIGEAIMADEPHPRIPHFKKDRKKYVNFVNDTTHAITTARADAIDTLRRAMETTELTSKITETVTETRFRKVKDEKTGKITEQPYEVTKTTTREVINEVGADWRAAVEYLKRRDKRDWSDKITIEHTTTWEQQLVEAIRKGEVAYDPLRKRLQALGQEELADRLFSMAFPAHVPQLRVTNEPEEDSESE